MVEWIENSHPIPYENAIESMEKRVSDIIAGTQQECVWLLEHPSIYTAGTSANPKDLLNPGQFPIHTTGRGGQYTYHGPGIRIAYVMLNLKHREQDIKKFVCNLEQWLINTLKALKVTGERRQGRVGIWVTDKKGNEAKIAALGIRVRKWITFHGVALNINPNLSHFTGIVPCGIKEYGVTSLKELGINTSTKEIDTILKQEFTKIFD